MVESGIDTTENELFTASRKLDFRRRGSGGGEVSLVIRLRKVALGPPELSFSEANFTASMIAAVPELIFLLLVFSFSSCEACPSIRHTTDWHW